MEQRLTKFLQWMKKQDVDVAWITSTESVYYFTGCYIEPHERVFGLFLFAKGDAILIFPQLEAETVRNAAWKHMAIGYDDHQDPWQLVQSRLKAELTTVKVVAFEQESITFSKYDQFASIFPQQVEWIAADQAIQQIRMIKDANEMKQIQQAAKLADEAMQMAVDSIRKGCTELEVAANVEYALKKRGIHKMAFETIVLFGEKTALPHGFPAQTTLKEGDFILIDLGVRVNGYCSDLTRTFGFRTMHAKQKKMLDTVLAAQQTAIRICKPQTPIHQVDQAARSIITDAGYGNYFIHRTGHGLGLSIHEYPSVSEVNHALLQPGMVITVEPGIYLPGVGGVRIEDDIAITDEGYQVLTQFPRELQVLK